MTSQYVNNEIWVDYDDTLYYPRNNEYNANLIKFLLEEKQKGTKLTLWTGRNYKDIPDIVLNLEQLGLCFDNILSDIKKPNLIIDNIARNPAESFY